MYKLLNGYHTWGANLSWMLGHFHRLNNFIICSHVSKQTLTRSSPSKEAELSGFAREVALIFRYGYKIKNISKDSLGIERIVMSPPTEEKSRDIISNLTFLEACMSKKQTIGYFLAAEYEIKSYHERRPLFDSNSESSVFTINREEKTNELYRSFEMLEAKKQEEQLKKAQEEKKGQLLIINKIIGSPNNLLLGKAVTLSLTGYSYNNIPKLLSKLWKKCIRFLGGDVVYTKDEYENIKNYIVSERKLTIGRRARTLPNKCFRKIFQNRYNFGKKVSKSDINTKTSIKKSNIFSRKI